MGKHPSEHASRLVRWQRRARNVRRRIMAWGVSGLLAVLMRTPRPVLRVLERGCLRPIMQLMLWRKAERNLTRAFGNQMDKPEVKRVLREMFRGTAALMTDWMMYTRRGPAWIDEVVDDKQARAMMHELERSWAGGWIGVTGHLGNWELGAQWMHHCSLHGLGATIAKRQPNPHLNRIVEKVRGKYGMATMYRDDTPTKVLRLLKSGRSIGITADQDSESLGGVFLDFLGRQAYTLIGPARLAWAANVPLVVGVVLRRGDRFEVVLNEPIFPDKSKPKDEELLRMTQAWSSQIEAAIRNDPEQWPWFHDRWKTTPERLEQKKRKTLRTEAAGAAGAAG